MRKGAIGLRRQVFVGAVASLAVLLGLVTAGSIPTVAWAATKFHSAPTPKISGTVRVGSKLTAKPGTWRPRGSLKYQWRLSGRPVSGARKSTWVIPASAKGKTITVRVTGSRKGYKTTSKTSKATGKVAAGVFTAPTPKVSGTTKVGNTLTAHPGAWSPAATLAYQWKRAGATIAGATKATYTLTATDAGKAITVTVTGSKSGYATTSKTSTAVIPIAVSDPSAAERSALIDLYNATNGAGWITKTRWNTAAGACTWYGVTCTNEHVTDLDLYHNAMSGSIPASLGNLTRLRDLELGDNALSGTIPTTLSNLTRLQSLDLDQNQLSGRIPTTLGNLTKLQTLNLFINHLSGRIPTTLGNLTRLETLNLYANQLSGRIPTTLGNLTQLQELYLDDNQLLGNIPTTVGNLNQLTDLGFSDNQLSGSIPTALGNLTQLRGLDLTHNQLSGSIPTTLGNLTQLWDLDLGNNQLSGSIPTTLGNLTELQELDLTHNQLSGAIPTTVGNLASLWDLYLDDNQLSGPVPTSLQNLDLEFLHLSGNGCLTASGSLATWLTDLDSGWSDGCTG